VPARAEGKPVEVDGGGRWSGCSASERFSALCLHVASIPTAL
jgi:hypothetical protein